MDEAVAAIEALLRERRAEIAALTRALDALDGGKPRERSGRRRRSRAASERFPPVEFKDVSDATKLSRPAFEAVGAAGGRRKRKRLPAAERRAQVLHAIREAGAGGIRTSELAKQVGVAPSYLTSRVLSEMGGDIKRPRRGVVAAK